MNRWIAFALAAGLGLGAAACGAEEPPGPGATGAGKPVEITVNCMPPKTNKAERKIFEDDMAEFQKLNPDIKITKAGDAFPCYDPKTFEPRLAAGRLETVFFVNFPNVRQLVKKGQAAEITPYLDEVDHFGDLNASAGIFGKDGKVYGLPTDGYGMGFVYNRALFEKAGLDPDAPPTTWAEVRDAAKRIAALGPGHVGFGEYSGGNTGGWHFTATLYGLGGDVLTPDGKRAAFNSPQGRAVLENLKQMRWTDDSTGSKLYNEWADLMKAMAGGKMGMMLGAPDVLINLRNDFQAEFENYAVTAQPEAKAVLSGGAGYMINPKATPEEIKAGLKWIEFKFLTPGKGQFDYARNKAEGLTVGQPYPDLFKTGTEVRDEVLGLREQHQTVPPEQFGGWVEGSADIPPKAEPGPYAQEIYAILDTPMSAVLTRRDADVGRLLADAEKKVNDLLAKKG